jgi:L-threonylcarbamoyladenylate synthase
MTIGADDPRLVHIISNHLRDAGVVIMPCDTIYGLVGLVPESEERIRAVKGRGEDKPFLQLVADVSWVADLSDSPPPPKLSRHWPGPLTVVVRGRAGGTVAVRVPDSPLLREIIMELGRPLYSTSVNRTGQPSLWRIREIRAEFEDDVDLIVDAGDRECGMASTLVDATVKPARILRQGGLVLPPSELE